MKTIEVHALIQQAISLKIEIYWHGVNPGEGAMGVYDVGRIGIDVNWPDELIYQSLLSGINKFKEYHKADAPGIRYMNYYRDHK